MTDTHDHGDRGEDGKRYRLTLKQEAFCRAYVETSNASEAYRQAYPGSDRWKDEALWVRASRLLGNAKVGLRINALMADAAKRHETTIDSITSQLDDDRKLIAAMSEADLQAHAAYLQGHLADTKAELARRQHAVVGDAGEPAGAIGGRYARPSGVAPLKAVED